MLALVHFELHVLYIYILYSSFEGTLLVLLTYRYVKNNKKLNNLIFFLKSHSLSLTKPHKE